MTDTAPTSLAGATRADVQTTPILPPTITEIPGVTRERPRELDPAARATWERIAALTERRAELDEQIEVLKEQLRDHLDDGEFAIDGQKVFSVVAQRRWNDEQASKVLPPELVAQLQVTVLSAKTAEQVLSPVMYRLCQIEHGKRKVVPVREGGRR